jgi:hypothetical protein
MNGSTTPGARSRLADGSAAGRWVLDPAGSAAEFGMTWSPLHMASMTALGTVTARFTRT